jgi:hypothetical protein
VPSAYFAAIAVELLRHRVHARQLGVDLAGDEVLLAQRLEQLVQRLAFFDISSRISSAGMKPLSA